jgi:hypothetical protein
LATSIPEANVTLQETAGAGGTGTDNQILIAPVAENDDGKPRLFGSAAAIAAFHGYGPAVEYASLHFAKTRKPVLVCGVPISTAGLVTRLDTAGNTGTSNISVAAGSDGVLHEHDGEVRVLKGGTVGTDQIVLERSLDAAILGDDRTFKPFRLGTASSMALEQGVTVTFGAGTLVAGDTIATWHGTGPRPDSDGIALARTKLAAQTKLARSWLLCGDLQNSTEAAALVTHIEAYETENQRFEYARAGIKDRLPLAVLGDQAWHMSGAPVLTFTDGGTGSDTIVRSTGSWLTDGAATGDFITTDMSGTANDFTTRLLGVSATALTVATGTITAGTATGAVTGHTGIAASGGTFTRSRGSWLLDGFATGDSFEIDGSASNDAEYTSTGVSSTVLTFSGTAVSENFSAADATVTQVLAKADWMADADEEFAAVNSERVDLSAGRCPDVSPYSGWSFRNPASWFASTREFQHDVHIATYQKDLGPVGGDLPEDEWDDRADGSAGSQARFTTLRTWSNGPEGAFVTQSLTRSEEGKLSTHTENMAVIDVAMTVLQSATENTIGRNVTLDSDGHATGDARKLIEAEINGKLEDELLTNKFNEGARASKAVWTMGTTDQLNVAEPTVTGVLELILNGKIFKMNTVVRVAAGG